MSEVNRNPARPGPADRSRYHVPNLDRALSVMELLSGMGEGLNVSEISEALKIPKNSAFRIAVTLESRGYLARNELTKLVAAESDDRELIKQVFLRVENDIGIRTFSLKMAQKLTKMSSVRTSVINSSSIFSTSKTKKLHSLFTTP